MAAVYPGHAQQLLFGPESTYGTENFLTTGGLIRCKSAVLTGRHDYTNNLTEYNGVVGATQVNGADIRQVPSLVIEKTFNSEDSYFFLTHYGDTSDSTLETGVGQHIITQAFSDYDIDSSLSFQKNEDADVITQLGMKCSMIELAGNSNNNEITAKYTLTGKTHANGDGSWDGGSATYLATQDFFWRDFTVALGDDSLNAKVTAWSYKSDNGMVPEWASSGSKYTVEPQPKTWEITGSITAWYESDYLKDLYTAGTLLDITFTLEAGTLIGATKYPKCIIAMTKAQITETPTVQVDIGSRALITFNYRAFADTASSNKQVTVTIQDTKTTLTKHS